MLDVSEISTEMLVKLLATGCVKVAFSNEGEEHVLSHLFGKEKKNGFYVDVGAHHPLYLSNTAALYYRGWRGINIDATPGQMQPFEEWRPDDVNLECCVTEDGQPVEFVMFSEPLLNTTCSDTAGLMPEKIKIQEKRTLPSRRLDDILHEYVPLGTSVDLLNVDVEGADLAVLRSNDWAFFKPKVLIVESWGFDINRLEDSEVYQYLSSVGMRLFAKLNVSLVFVDPDYF